MKKMKVKYLVVLVWIVQKLEWIALAILVGLILAKCIPS